ncbi:MAG: TRAP transporter fused permease subunit [Pseudomonadota bacterium]
MAEDRELDRASGAEESGSVTRDPPASWAAATAAFGVLLAVFHLYAALTADVDAFVRNALHFAGFAILCSVYFPLSTSDWWVGRRWSRWVDLAFGLLAAASAAHLSVSAAVVAGRGDQLRPVDWAAAIFVVVAALELTRRTAGLVIPMLAIFGLSYLTWLGPYISGVFAFRGLSLETVLRASIFNDEAIFGIIAQISATYVFLFIIFGAFLLRSGAGDFVVNLARAVAGRLTGGAGMVAVIASGLTGTISGSAVANTASTGAVTIPLMKRAGFPPTFAAGVEASASTGGQLMPPIMGAGAFVMASYTQIPYETIVAVAALPALLYFASVAMFVRIEAKRQGLAPMANDGPTLREALRDSGASFIIPITTLITLLVVGFTPEYAAVFGIATVVVSSWLTKHPMGLRAVWEALALGARNMVMTAVLLCTVGLVVNVIAMAGIGNTFSLMIVEWSGGDLLIAIVLIALASLVLGMGLPVTAAYIVLATLSAPALSGMIQDGALIQQIAAGTVSDAAKPLFMLADPNAVVALSGPMSSAEAVALLEGLPLELRAQIRELALPSGVVLTALLSAHMIIFWLSQDSNVTPPVCLAAFTAAAIAKSPAMATGFASWKIAKGLYIVPLLFAFTPFLSGDPTAAFTIFAFGLVGMYGLAGALQGWMERRLSLVERAAAGVAGAACIWPAGLLVNLAGVVGVLAIIAIQFGLNRKREARAAE